MPSMNDRKRPQDGRTPTAKNPMPQPTGRQNPGSGNPTGNPGTNDPRR